MDGIAGWDLGFDSIKDTDAGCLGHGCCRPMGRFPGRIGTGEGHHNRIDDQPAQRRDARGTGFVAQQAVDAGCRQCCQPHPP
jgi:hypothetical protein